MKRFIALCVLCVLTLNLSPILAVGEPSSNAENEGVHYTVYEYDAIVAKKEKV